MCIRDRGLLNATMDLLLEVIKTSLRRGDVVSRYSGAQFVIMLPALTYEDGDCLLYTSVGDPFFDSVESVFSHILFSVPAVKGVEFGAGFGIAQMFGSQANDAFYYDENGGVRTRTNYNGGVLGGITTGMPVVFRAALKPTPSIAKEQDTIDLARRENVKLTVRGRHDPCIVPRAVPVIEAAAAIAALDILMGRQEQTHA